MHQWRSATPLNHLLTKQVSVQMDRAWQETVTTHYELVRTQITQMVRFFLVKPLPLFTRYNKQISSYYEWFLLGSDLRIRKVNELIFPQMDVQTNVMHRVQLYDLAKISHRKQTVIRLRTTAHIDGNY